MLNKYFGSYEDLTRDRLLDHQNWEDYDVDGAITIRRAVDAIVKLPVLGTFLLPIFCNLMMLQTLATKRRC